MLNITQKWLLSFWDYSFVLNGKPIGNLRVPWSFILWKDGNFLVSISGDTYEISSPFFTASYLATKERNAKLLQGNNVVAMMKFPKLESNDLFLIEFGNRNLSVKRNDALMHEIWEDNIKLGEIVPNGIFSRKRTVKLPVEIPLALQIFIFVGTVIRLKSQIST